MKRETENVNGKTALYFHDKSSQQHSQLISSQNLLQAAYDRSHKHYHGGPKNVQNKFNQN